MAPTTQNTGNQFGAPARTVSTPEATKRERARGRVAGAARNGERPSRVFPPGDLDWCFRDREDELAELEELAEQVLAERTEQRRRRNERQELERVTAGVLKEWSDAEQAKLRKRAEAEAKKRLAR